MNGEVDELLARLDAHPGSLLFARLADAYVRADKLDRAIEVCEQGLSHYHDYVSAHVVMAKCYYKVGLPDQAKEEYLRILELDGEHQTALLCLGDIYYEGKKFDLALNFYQRILQLDPNNEFARKRLSSLKSNRTARVTELNGNLQGEEDKETQENSIATFTLAEIYASQGFTDKAIHVLRRLQEQNPVGEEILTRIQKLEKMLQETDTGGDHGLDS